MLRAPFRATTDARLRGRGFTAAAAGLLLLAGTGLVARELFQCDGAPPAPASADPAEDARLAADAAVDAGDPIEAEARDVVAAARRSEPPPVQVERAAGRRARPGSERHYLERFRALAAADAAAFETSARERLATPAPLAEKVAWLLAARELGRDRYDPLVDLALDEGRRADQELRVAAVVLLERDARRSAPACLRLLRAIALAPDRDFDRSERSRAASDAFACADEPTLAEAVTLVASSTDLALRADVLRGLARNPLPAAAAQRDHFVSTLGWLAPAEEVELSD